MLNESTKPWSILLQHDRSLQCSKCGHIDPESRISQAEFICKICQYLENADFNVAKIIKACCIKQILDFSKSQDVSSESLLAGARGWARPGIIRPKKPKISMAVLYSTSSITGNIASNIASRNKRETRYL